MYNVLSFIKRKGTDDLRYLKMSRLRKGILRNKDVVK